MGLTRKRRAVATCRLAEAAFLKTHDGQRQVHVVGVMRDQRVCIVIEASCVVWLWYLHFLLKCYLIGSRGCTRAVSVRGRRWSGQVSLLGRFGVCREKVSVSIALQSDR